MNAKQCMAELASAFEWNKRPDGSQYVRVRKDAPGWVPDNAMRLIHEAVDGSDPRFPDDWVYASAMDIASAFDGYGAEDIDDMRENVHEIVDGLVDIYTTDLLEWAKHSHNLALVDEAKAELGEAGDLDKMLQMGQYLGLERIASALLSMVEGRLSEVDA